MCLAIPAQVRTINENNLAVVDILGVTREVGARPYPFRQVGDFVLVHAGFALSGKRRRCPGNTRPDQADS